MATGARAPQGDPVHTLLRQIANYSGRASRREYWINFVIYATGTTATILLLSLWPDSTFAQSMDNGMQSPFAILLLALGVIGNYGVLVRRLHDVGLSGWQALWMLFPGVGFLLLLPWLLEPGDPRTNQHGPPPGRE